MGIKPVVRARREAQELHSTLVLRVDKYFELALPVLPGDDEGGRPYPPPDAILRLVSKGGYECVVAIAKGVCTEDEYCSIRFCDIDESYGDDEFTATLEWDDERETIFRDKRIATFISAARDRGEYEPPFGPGPEEEPSRPMAEFLLVDSDELE